MKFKNIFLLQSLLITFMLTVCAEPEKPILPFIYNIIPIVKDLKNQKWISQCRLAIIPTILGIALCCNHKNLIQNIQEHPISFLAASYFLSNYLIDTWSKYQQLNQSLQLFLFSQTMSRYMLCLLATKNTMNNLCLTKNTIFDEQDFSNTIIKQTGHSLEELELFTFELLNNSISCMNNACIDINSTNLEEKIYYLFKDQTSLEQMLLICKDDAILYEKLIHFYENPEENYKETLQQLCNLIRSHFNCFIKKGLDINTY